MFEEWEGGGFVEDPVLLLGAAKGHGAEDDFGDFEARGAETVVFHFGGWCGCHGVIV